MMKDMESLQKAELDLKNLQVSWTRILYGDLENFNMRQVRVEGRP